MKTVILLLVIMVALAGCATSDKSTAATCDEGMSQGNDCGPRLAATCLYSHSSEDDPMFKPTSHPPAHGHDFFGNETTNQNSTIRTLLAGSTLCKQDGDFSAWWVTQFSANGIRLQPSRLLVYYQVTKNMPQREIKAFPVGFRDVSRTPEFRCGDGEFRSSLDQCSSDTIDVRLLFEQCYDPKHPAALEANTTKPRRGKCPETHPILLPVILVQTTYRLRDGARDNFTVAGNTGDYLPMTNYHANFMNAWRQDKLKSLVDLCLHQTTENEPRPLACRTGESNRA